MVPFDEMLRAHPLVALPVLFAAGVATSVLPCVYPMIPIVAGILGGTGSEQRSRGRTIGFVAVYVLGLSLVYAVLGLIAGLTGSLFGSISSNPWAYFTIGNLLLLAGLAMLEVFPISVPARILTWTTQFGAGSYTGVFAMGATSGLVAAPCGAPAFAAVLTFVASTGSGVLGFVYLFVFSVGMCTLLAVVGLASGFGARLPKAGAWMVWVKRAAGVLLLAMAEYYFIQMGKVS